MTGVSYMIPFVAAGGILIALGFMLAQIFGGETGAIDVTKNFTLDPSADPSKVTILQNSFDPLSGMHWAALLFLIGSAAFGFLVPILSGHPAAVLGVGLLGSVVAGVGVLGIAAMAQAMTERAFALTLEYTRDRQMFGQRLFDFQNSQFKLAEAKTSVTVGRAFLDACVAALLDGSLSGETAAMAKLWITETECRVIDDCLQLFGGYGYMDEYPISRLWRDSRIDRVHGGASEVMKLIIARGL